MGNAKLRADCRCFVPNPLPESFMESPEAISLDFKKYWLSLKRRWLPAVGVLGCVIAIAAVQASSQKPSYEAQGKLLIKRTDQTSSLTGVGQQIGQLDTLDQKSSPINTEIEVVRSLPLLQKTIATLDLRDKPEELGSEVKLKNLTATDILQVSYTSGDSKKAAAVVNKLMSLYIENNVLTNRAEAVAAGDFIAKQLPATEATVRRAELALRQFKEQNHVVALNEEANAEVAAMQKLESDIADTRAQLADENARFTDLQHKVGMNSQEAIAVDSLNNAGLQKLLEDLQQMEGQLAQEQTRFWDTHPTIEALKAKKEALQTLVQKQVEQFLGQKQVASGDLQMGPVKRQVTEDFVASDVKRLGLASHLASLSDTLVAYQERVNLLPKLEQDQRELQRQVEAAQSTYEILLKKLQEVRVAENQNVGNARIIEAALVPEHPSNGKKKIILVLGGVLGILLSTAIVIVLEIIDTSIKTLKEAKEAFGYTLLGAIPSLKKKAPLHRRNAEWPVPELPVRDTPRSAIAETYRMLQANLKFLSSDKPLQVIVVTSSVPKEGKSTVSANLAAAMAQLGRRVLLVDADMHHPIQHHVWELTNAAGLSDVIVGQAEFKAVVNAAMDNLDVLTCGVIPPNPLALLDSMRMASLIEDFSAIYDFVILDAPPLILAADALTLGKMTDGVLLVARPGVVNSTSAAGAKELLERSSQKVLGLVIDGVIVENEPDSYFYYAKEYSAGEYSSQKVTAKTREHAGHS